MAKFKSSVILNSTSSRVGDLSIFLLAVLIVIFQTPILSRNLPNVVLLGLMALFLVAEVNRLLNLRDPERTTLIALVLYVLMTAVYKVLGISAAELYYIFNTIQFLFFTVAALTVFYSLTKRQMKFLLGVSLISILYTMIDNVILFVRHGAAAYVKLFQLHKYDYNAVDTPFSGAILLLAGVCFICFLHEKRKWLKVGLLALSVFGIYFCVAITQRTIILVLAVLMYPMLIFFHTKHKLNRYILFFFVLVIAVVALLNYKPLLLWMGEMLGSARVSKRINQIIVFMETMDIRASGGSLTVRYELISTSWRTFTASARSFLLGVGEHRATDLIVGNHSQFIDELARYGIVGSAMVWTMLCSGFRFVKKAAGTVTGTVLNRQLGVMIFIFILRGFLGAVFAAPIGIQLFLVMPLMLRLLQGDSAAPLNPAQKDSKRG